MRYLFDQQLELLNKELIKMGAIVEQSINYVILGLTSHEAKYGEMVADNLNDIHRQASDIERLCMKLLLQQQPVASDLRLISSALKMVNDMQRIGVNCDDIMQIINTIEMGEIEEIQLILNMANATIIMIQKSIDAFVNKDEGLSKAVIESDDIVDNYFKQIKTQLMDKLTHQQIDGEIGIDLLMVAKYFERIADHSSQISKWVVYSITGETA